MKNLFLIITLLCAVEQLIAQQDADSTVHGYRYTKRFETVTAEGGITVPIGSMKQHMNIAPNVAFWIRQKRSERTVFNYGFSVNFPAQRRFFYAGSNETAVTRSFSGFAGMQVDKIYPISAHRFIDIEWGTAFGYGFYFYDDLRARHAYEALPRGAKDKDEEPAFVKPLNSIFLGQSLKLRLRDFGLQARYNFTPYSAFNGVVDRSFGMHSITVGLFYRQ